MQDNELDSKAKKAGFWYSIGNILTKGLVFITLPIFTRILATEDFGIYNTYIAYEGILTALIGLGLYGTVKNAKLDYKEKFNEYMSSVLSLSILCLVFFIILGNLLFPVYGKFINFTRFVINCLILQSYGSFLINFYGVKLNIEFKYKSFMLISSLNIIVNILSSILLILYVFPNQRYLGRIIGSAFPLIMISIVLTFCIIKNGKKLYDKKYWKYALSMGIPLVPHVISQSLLSQSDRIMINNLIGASEAGLYSYIYTMCTILYVIFTSLDNAWTPWVYINLDKKNEKNIYKKSKNYLLLCNILIIGFLCLVPDVTKLLAGKEYWGGIELSVPLSIANYFILLYMLPVGIEYFNKKTKCISLGTVLATIVNVILNYFLIIVFGYKAAAYTTMIAYILLFIFHWIIASKFDIEKIYNRKYIIKSIVLILFIGILILISNNNEILSIVVRYVILVVVLIFIYNKKELLLSVIRREQNEKNI